MFVVNVLEVSFVALESRSRRTWRWPGAIPNANMHDRFAAVVLALVGLSVLQVRLLRQSKPVFASRALTGNSTLDTLSPGEPSVHSEAVLTSH